MSDQAHAGPKWSWRFGKRHSSGCDSYTPRLLLPVPLGVQRWVPWVVGENSVGRGDSVEPLA